jgi:hypothetical protein
VWLRTKSSFCYWSWLSSGGSGLWPCVPGANNQPTIRTALLCQTGRRRRKRDRRMCNLPNRRKRQRLDSRTCQKLLHKLLDARFLTCTDDGQYKRAES